MEAVEGRRNAYNSHGYYANFLGFINKDFPPYSDSLPSAHSIAGIYKSRDKG